MAEVCSLCVLFISVFNYETGWTAVTMREGYGVQEAVRCTQTQRWSPEGPAVLVCCRASLHLSCSSSSSDSVLPTAGPAGRELEHHRTKQAFSKSSWFCNRPFLQHTFCHCGKSTGVTNTNERVPVRQDSVMVNQLAQYQDPETEAAE